MSQVLAKKISLLSNQELLKLSEELQSPTVPDDALIRDLIKDTEFDTTAPVLAFISVGAIMGFELAKRLKLCIDVIKSLVL